MQTHCERVDTVVLSRSSNRCLTVNDSISMGDWSSIPEYSELNAHYFPFCSAIVFVVISIGLLRMSGSRKLKNQPATVVVLYQPNFVDPNLQTIQQNPGVTQSPPQQKSPLKNVSLEV